MKDRFRITAVSVVCTLLVLGAIASICIPSLVRASQVLA